MSRHVDLEIADIVTDRLSESREREIAAHLDECDVCAAGLAWARGLRDEALRQGLRHLMPMRVVELAGDPPAASEVEYGHLKHCTECRDELEWARRVREEDVASISAAARSFRWIWLAGATAAIVLLLIFLPRQRDADYSRIARVEPLPVRISRAVPEPGSFEESRLLALESYAAGEYTAAQGHFEAAAELDPDNAEVQLYLGSTLMLTGELDAAANHLNLARDLSGDSRVGDEASWQLANLMLIRGRRTDALGILRELQTGGGHRSEDARKMIESLD